MKKPVNLCLLILKLSKILMFNVWYDYVKPKYGEKTKLCYMDKNGIYEDIVEDVETRFDTSNYELDRSLHKRKNKKQLH